MTEQSAEKAEPPIRDGERVWIAGEPVWVHYDPDLTLDGTPRWGCSTWEPTGLNSVEVKPYGAVQEATHVQVGMRRVIRLRRWDERVFLHEVLHVLLGKQYPPGQHAYDGTFIEDPKHEKAVREIEDGLWDMGWRLFDGQSHIDPSLGPRLPGRLFPPEGSHLMAEKAHIQAEALEHVADLLDDPDTLPDLSIRQGAMVVRWLRERADYLRTPPGGRGGDRDA